MFVDVSTGSGAVGGVGRGVDLVNISAVTQATAFATGDPDRSYGAAVVPVGQGHRKKRRTLAAKVGICVCPNTSTHSLTFLTNDLFFFNS